MLRAEQRCIYEQEVSKLKRVEQLQAVSQAALGRNSSKQARFH